MCISSSFVLSIVFFSCAMNLENNITDNYEFCLYEFVFFSKVD